MPNEIISASPYDEFTDKINEVKDACNFLPDVSDDEGYKKSKRVSLDVGKILVSIESARKDLKADSLAFGRKIDSEAKSIAAQLSAFQEPHKLAYKALDDQKKERERVRKEKLESRVSDISNLPELMRDHGSDDIKMALESLLVEECLDFYEYAMPALEARNASKSALSKMFGDKLKQEKDAVELATLRKKQKDQEQQERDGRIARDARDEAEKGKQDAIEAADESERQRVAADERTKLQKEKAERDAIDAVTQAKQDAIDAANKATQDAVDAQKAKEASELAEQQRRDANTRNVGSKRRRAKECLMAIGLTEQEAKDVVMAIHHKKIDSVSIKY